uniref:Uncharacterized protein n=1 Tax=Pogona vitticeps TaxID=103695 RepID=A0ABM5EZC9_9SAUR
MPVRSACRCPPGGGGGAASGTAAAAASSSSGTSARLEPPPPINTAQPGVTTSRLYSGAKFRGQQRSKGNAYEVEVVVQDPGQLQGAAGEGPGRGVGASGRSETQPEGALPPPGTEAELPGTSTFALLPEAPVAVSLHPDLDLELVGGSRRETQPEEAAAAGAKENTGSYRQRLPWKAGLALPLPQRPPDPVAGPPGGVCRGGKNQRGRLSRFISCGLGQRLG